MSVWCCAGAMGTALSQQEESSADPAEPQPPTMADFMRLRRRKGGALCSLRRRLRRTPPPPPDREAAISRQLRSIVSGWSRAELAALLFVLRREAARGEAANRADAARPRLRAAGLTSCWCDVMISWSGGSVPAHAFVLAARTQYWRGLGQEPQPHRVVSLPANCGAVSRGELLATLRLIYGNDKECGSGDPEICLGLDILDNSGDNNEEDVSGVTPPATLLAALGVSRDTFANDMIRVRREGILVDCTVCVSSRRFPCHRAVLANASRYFRSVIGRNMGGAGAGGHSSLVVDPLILPPRFIHALLHCAYSNQVDISLIEPSSPPVVATSTGWGSAKGNKVAAADKLEDIFQLYEIAKFCEMERCAMLCEALAVSSITVHNVGLAVRWARLSHASDYVLRGALMFVRSSLAQVLSAPPPAELSAHVLWAARAALSAPAALSCSDDTAARALLHHYRHARRLPPESPWSRSSSESTTSLKQFMAPFLPHIRTEHLPTNHPLFSLGVCPRVLADPKDAWLGRGVWRPPRPLPAYLHTVQALVEPAAVSDAEVQEVLRANTMPDTLYMVGGSRTSDSSSVTPAPSWSQLEPGCVRRLLARVRQLMRQQPPALQQDQVLQKHVMVQAARELGVPASSAVAALAQYESCGERGVAGRADREAALSSDEGSTSRDATKDWCDGLEAGSAEVCELASERTSLRLHSQRDSRRRELPAVVAEGHVHSVPRAVPDVAAPDGNTHLLYPSSGPGGRVLTLDLGDGATHAPARGSRAHRAMRSRGDGQLCRERGSAGDSADELDLRDAAACPLYQPRRLTPSPTYNPHPRSHHLSLTHTAFTLNPYNKHSNLYGEGSRSCDLDDTFGHEKYLNTGENESFGHEKYLSAEKNESFGHEKYLNTEQNDILGYEKYEHDIPCPTEFENSHNRKQNNDFESAYLEDLADSEMYTSGFIDSIQSQMGSYRDLKSQSELYTQRNVDTNLDYLERKSHCHLPIDSEAKRSHTNSLQRNFKAKFSTLELYSGKNDYKGQGSAKDERLAKTSDYINCTLPKNSSNSKRNQNQDYCGLPTECFTEKEYYTKTNNFTKGDILNKNLKTKDLYKDSRSLDPYQEFRNEQIFKERDKTKTNQSYNIDNIELKALKIHCDSYSSGKDYHTGSLKVHKGRNTQNLAQKNVSKDYNTLNTRIDSCGSISSHGTLMPRSNSSLSGRNSAQSSQSSHMSAQSGHLSAQSGHMSAQSGHLSSQSGQMSAQSGHLSAQSGHMSAQSGHLSAQSGHMSAQSGHMGAQSGQMSSHSGFMSALSGHLSAQSGHMSAQSGHMGAQSGFMSALSGHVSAKTGHNSVTGRSSPHSGVFNNYTISSVIGLSSPTHLLGSSTPQSVNLGVNVPNTTLTHYSTPKSGSPHSFSHKYQSEVSHSASLEYGVRDVTSPRHNMSPRDSVSSRDGLSDRDRLSPRNVMSTRDVSSRRDPTRDISSRDAISSREISTREMSSRAEISSLNRTPRDGISTRDISTRDISSRDKSSRDSISTGSMSSSDVMSSQLNTTSRDISARDRTPSDFMSTRDISPRDMTTRDRTPRDVSTRDVSTRDVSSRDISGRDRTPRDISARDAERGRHAVPGHVRPRSQEREPGFSLHTAHPSHSSDVKSTTLYRVDATDIGLPGTPPHHS